MQLAHRHLQEGVAEAMTAEELSVQVQHEAEPTNMSVWSQRVLVRRLDPYVAECVASASHLIICSEKFARPEAFFVLTGNQVYCISQ